jgi:low temperature requirement protein LtrA
VRATDEEHRATTFELFFDLVFVFAFTQVTALVAHDLTARGVGRGLILVALLWWAWCSYAWLGNQARADEGALRAAMGVAMGAMLVIALTIPETWDDLPGGLDAPLVLVLAFAVVRILHLSVYALAAVGDRGLLRQLGVTAVPVAAACALLVVGAVASENTRTLLWVAALVVDYSGIYLAGADGWRVPAPVHFAERHGLIVLIALGESIVAIGVGVAGLAMNWGILLGAVLAFGTSMAMWWLYFDVVALVGERVLHRREGRERARMARDSYTYLHFPMIVGILASALGVKKVISYVADTGHHAFTDALPPIPAAALAAGPALYILALVAFRLRNVGTLNIPRLVAGSTLLVLVPAVAALPALGGLGLVTAVLTALVTFEAVHDAEARDAVRHDNAIRHPVLGRHDEAATS